VVKNELPPGFAMTLAQKPEVMRRFGELSERGNYNITKRENSQSFLRNAKTVEKYATLWYNIFIYCFCS
jgi:hypothetical protein